ncbi:hypothetical protein [Oceanobacillus kapialis]|uniref:hypothetical protein n=1 Tax=Oceanobacillus kapialis TaxID=481353 RepID=UPI00384C7861
MLSFVVSIGIVVGLIQVAGYLINDLLHLTGWMKTFSQFNAVILSLYPVKFTFWSVVNKITSDVRTNV